MSRAESESGKTLRQYMGLLVLMENLRYPKANNNRNREIRFSIVLLWISEAAL